MARLFRLIPTHDRHDGTTWNLYDETSDRYVAATWSRFHSAYDCTVTEIDYDDDTETTYDRLLTDGDLVNAVIR